MIGWIDWFIFFCPCRVIPLTTKISPKMVNPRYLDWSAEEEVWVLNLRSFFGGQQFLSVSLLIASLPQTLFLSLTSLTQEHNDVTSPQVNSFHPFAFAFPAMETSFSVWISSVNERGRGQFQTMHSRMNQVGWVYKPRSSLCTHAFHLTDSKYPDIHFLDGWIPTTKTQHVPSMKTECDYLNGWIKKSHTQKSHPKWWTPEI